MAATMNHAERRHIPDRRLGSGRTSHGVKRMRAAEWIPMLLLIIGGISTLR